MIGKELFEGIINDMEDQIQLFEKSALGVKTIGESWYKKIILIREKLKNLNDLANFRYNNLVVSDEPSGDRRAYKLFSHVPCLLKYTAMGTSLEDKYAFIQKHDLKELLVENPVGDIGAPVCYKKK